MIFRRRGEKRQRGDDGADEGGPEPEEPAEPALPAELATSRPHGPWDRDETTADEGDDTYIDLGGLVVRSSPELELRLQVDQNTGAVESVMYAGPKSGLELRAFAAPRSGGIWDDVRHEIAGEAGRMGGTATEIDGEFGTELQVSVPVQTPDGRHATQVSRVVGAEGPRWLLRGTFLGGSATDPDPEGQVERTFREVIVVRGEEAMRPREPLPLQAPDSAQEQIEQQVQSPGDDSNI